MTVVNFPTAKSPDLFGPELTGSSLIVDERLVPKFHIHDRGDKVEFILDGRMSFEIPKEFAYVAASMAANAMAVGAGYPSLCAPNKEQPFAPQVMKVTLEDLSS